jgi:hypothetical protein
MPAKPVRINLLLSVGITEQIKRELELASEYFGLTPSQFGRQAIIEKLMREGIRRPPGIYRQQASTVQAAE